MYQNLYFGLLYLVFIGPIFEWTMHYLFHKFDLEKHKKHHIAYHKKSKIKFEKWALYTLIFFIITKFYVIALFNFKYLFIHTFIHRNPDFLYGIFKCYEKHHNIHHKNPKYNYGVTSIWPDKLFNTFLE